MTQEEFQVHVLRGLKYLVERMYQMSLNFTKFQTAFNSFQTDAAAALAAKDTQIADLTNQLAAATSDQQADQAAIDQATATVTAADALLQTTPATAATAPGSPAATA